MCFTDAVGELIDESELGASRASRGVNDTFDLVAVGKKNVAVGGWRADMRKWYGGFNHRQLCAFGVVNGCRRPCSTAS